MNYTENQNQAPDRSNLMAGLILSLSVNLGLILGILLDNLGMGLSLGLSVAVCLNALREVQQRKPGSRIALGFALLAVTAVTGIWVWFG